MKWVDMIKHIFMPHKLNAYWGVCARLPVSPHVSYEIQFEVYP
jgi:hypothetical protein